jgi:hypothetical protein
MRFRPVVLGLLVIWASFALAGFRNCGKTAPEVREPAPAPSLSSTDPSEVTQAYWLAARQVSKRAAKAVISREELQRKGAAIKSLADGKRIWAELAQSYSQATEVNTEAVKELKSLPTDRADPAAVECVTELADFLTLQADLFRKSGDQCGEMAVLLATIHAEGDAFDWNSAKGKQYESQEADLNSKMKRTAENEGAVEKRRLSELAAKAKTLGNALAKKHGRDFPDLLGN